MSSVLDMGLFKVGNSDVYIEKNKYNWNYVLTQPNKITKGKITKLKLNIFEILDSIIKQYKLMGKVELIND